MDALFRKSDRLLANTRTEIIRDKMGEIHWNAQLISIMAREVRRADNGADSTSRRPSALF